MEDKDLDKLFQDKFEGLQAPPDPAVWDRISSSLDQKKKKKRVVPIWLWPAGAAAVLMLSLWMGGVFDADPIDNSLPVYVNEDSEKKTDTPADKSPITTGVADSQNEGALSNTNKDQNSSEGTSSPTSGADGKQAPQRSTFWSSSSDKAVAKQSNAPKTPSSDERDTPLKKALEEQNTAVTSTPIQDKADSDPSQQTNTVVSKESTKEPAEQEAVTGKKDLFEVIKEQEAVAELSGEKLDAKKWSLNASVAPVYYNTIGEGSPIHSNFAANDKSGEINMSYGMNLAYSVNKRLKIRTGVHRVDLGYSTDDIVFSSSLSASTNEMIENIDYGANAVNLVVSSSATVNGDLSAIDGFSDIVAQSPNQSGQMRQQLRYLEFPLEMQYRFIDKKFSLDVIGGVSSLVLIDNEVSLSAEGRVTTMGEANNVNPLNFSTNLGLGLGYQLGDQWSLSVEPLFKYQLNTFEGEAGNFQPYSFGVYSGVNFRF